MSEKRVPLALGARAAEAECHNGAAGDRLTITQSGESVKSGLVSVVGERVLMPAAERLSPGEWRVVREARWLAAQARRDAQHLAAWQRHFAQCREAAGEQPN